MRLYYSPGACSLAPHIVFKETNTPVTVVKTDIGAKTYEGGGNYLKVSPLGFVPALELDDGAILTEVPAIVQYIADKAAATEIAPANGTFARCQMQSWLNFVATELHRGFAPLWNAKMPEDAKALARDRLTTRFKHLDSHFASNSYLMGATYTLPDAYAFNVLSWTKPLNIDLSAFPNLLAYKGRIAARPAVQAAMKAEGLI